MLLGAQSVFRDRAIGVALRHLVHRLTQGPGRPELLLSELGGRDELALVDQLHYQDVPGGERHDHHDDQRASCDDVSLGPKGTETIRIIDYDGGGLFFHVFLCGVRART